jgi:aspartyl/asparaginyl-tRNA synthetase
MNDMVKLEKDLLVYLGFGETDTYHEGDYDAIAAKYGVEELDHDHEASLETDYGKVFFLKNFPNHTSPFWNMKQYADGKNAYKVDVILHGIETIGSAQRSSSPEEMRKMFYSISDGQYANILFSNFTKERVEAELHEFLGHNFFDRCGGGIGVTRMIRAMKLSNLL